VEPFLTYSTEYGTFARDEWPPIHGAIQDAVFGLEVQGLSDLVEAPYGFVIAQRCPVEKATGRHILIRYQGAKRAEADVPCIFKGLVRWLG
jgi:hypothetical protein